MCLPQLQKPSTFDVVFFSSRALEFSRDGYRRYEFRPDLPPSFESPFRWKKQIASDTNGRSVRAVTSLSQAALPRSKLGQILESSSQFKPEIVATLDKRHGIESQVERRSSAVTAQGTVKESTTHMNPANL
jgi:hypothetical protein